MWALKDEVEAYDDNFIVIRTAKEEETDNIEGMTIPVDYDDIEIAELKKQIARNNDIAQANPPQEVDSTIWNKLCDQWESNDYQKLCEKNANNRKKLKIRHSTDSKSIYCLRKEKMKIVAIQSERDLERKDQVIADEVLAQVLKTSRSYVKGMGQGEIPAPSSETRKSKVAWLTLQREKCRSEVEFYKHKCNSLINYV
ncbi:hypothetical protein CJ030_MR6G013675 [Morella rubra]|uniref:Uncharacterized protein n=1 Tax=Morella rubra TaxID=262757 RepID=A0A6A1VCD6_9ROSI|nr:hypothetical protein CJ030_MR6G013675 [Morella rubra]